MMGGVHNGWRWLMMVMMMVCFVEGVEVLRFDFFAGVDEAITLI
jgi:hypothetical protein